MERAGRTHARTSPTRWHRIAGTALLVCTIALSLLVFQQNALNQARQNAYETLQQSTDDQVRLFRSMSDSRVTNMQELAGWFAQGNPTSDDVQGLLQSTRDDGGYYRAWLMDTDGTAVSNDGQTIDISDTGCYSSAMAGGSGIGCMTSRLNGEWICVIWAPIMRNGSVKGAVFSSLDASKFRDQLLCEAFGQDSYSYVCDSTGNVVIGTENDLGVASGQNILDVLSDATFTRGSLDDLRKALGEGGSGTMSLTSDGRARLAVYQPMGIDDWTIVTAANQTAVDAQVSEHMTGIYLLIAAILGLTFAFVAFVSVMVRRADASRLFDARHDKLTGLLNLDTFMDEAQEMVSKAPPSTYMLCNIDIDGFQSINEQYGHDGGEPPDTRPCEARRVRPRPGRWAAMPLLRRQLPRPHPDWGCRSSDDRRGHLMEPGARRPPHSRHRPDGHLSDRRPGRAHGSRKRAEPARPAVRQGTRRQTHRGL